MKRIVQFLYFSLLVLTFSCEPDAVFDIDTPETQLEGEWVVTDIESTSYTSTITSPNGTSDVSTGSFIGTDINMSLTFEADESFSTSGDYNQVLTVVSPLPNPIMIEARNNDFMDGGIWSIEDDVLRVQTSADDNFQNAIMNVFTDTEMELDYQYSRTIQEGTVTRMVEVNVTYVLEKQ